MKYSPLTAILLGALLISSVASAALCWSYSSHARELRMLQSQVNYVNTRNSYINQLAAEVIEYSKTHPDINPILESVGVKTKAAVTPPTAAPTTKPAGK